MQFKRKPQVCGLLFDSEFDSSIHDQCGGTLSAGHHESHEFVATDGQTWQWETDFACNCESCIEGDGDYCITYWTKPESGSSANC